MSVLFQPSIESISQAVLHEGETTTIVLKPATFSQSVGSEEIRAYILQSLAPAGGVWVTVYTTNASFAAPTIISDTLNAGGYRSVRLSGALNPTYHRVKMVLAKASSVYGQFTLNVSHISASGEFSLASVNLTLVNAQGQGFPPSAPVLINASATASDRIQVTLDIDATATQTTVACVPTSGPTVQLTFSDSGRAVKLVTGLQAAMQYTIAAASQSPSGTGPFSNQLTATTLATPTQTPDAVTGASAAPQSNTAIVISFTAAPTIYDGSVPIPNSYIIKRGTVSGGPYTTIATISGTTYTDTGLTSDTTYYYKITSTNAAGTGGTPAEFSAKTLRNPNIPRDFTSFTVTLADYTNLTLNAVYPGGTYPQTIVFSRATNPAGPFSVISTQGGVFTSSPVTYTFTDSGLATNTAYYYQVVATNASGSNTPSTANGTTSAPPATPGIPTSVMATALDDGRIQINWTPAAPLTQFGFYIYRSVSSGGTFTQVGTASSADVSFVDTGLSAGATYYYKIKAHGYAADSAFSSEVHATTFLRRVTVAPQFKIYLTKGRIGRSAQIANKLIWGSNLDRWPLTCQGRQYVAGLKPMLTAATVSASESGGLLGAGTYFISIVLLDSARQARSLPGPYSNQVTITGSTGKIVVTPPLETGDANVKVRDIAYEADGTQIYAADYWEIYLASTNIGVASLVALLPIETTDWEDSPGSKTYTIDDVSRITLTDGSRRPLEQNLENSLPPACSYLGVKRNRLIAFGETPFYPDATQQQAGAAVVIASAGHSISFSNFTISDAVLYKELCLPSETGGLRGTGWEIWDVESQTAYIRHADPNINASGFQGAGGTFTNFSLAPKGNVYFSAYYSGEVGLRPTFAPEGFPPLTRYNYEFFPEDNTDPVGVIPVGDALMIAKPSRWLYVQGGDEIDFPILDVTSISAASGLNNYKTIAKNRNEVVYFLGDAGLHRVRSSGVEKVSDYAGNSHMFQEVFDINSVSSAVATWFAREDYYVCCGLNRIGTSGNRDGFIFDEKNTSFYWFSTDRQMTSLYNIKNTTGEYQLLCGDTNGNVGIFLKQKLPSDGVDYNQANPFAASTPISGYAYSGLMDAPQALTINWVQPRIQSKPANLEIDCSFVVFGRLRMDDPSIYGQPDIRVPFSTTDTASRYRCGGNRFQQAIVGFEFTMPQNVANAQLQFREVPMRVFNRGAS